MAKRHIEDEVTRHVARVVASRCIEHKHEKSECQDANHRRDVHRLDDHLQMLGILPEKSS